MSILQIIQIISAVLLLIFILAQQKGAGIGVMGGGTGNQFISSRRGPEKVIFNGTVILAVIFVVSSIVLNFV
jgi:preprotein translocase subunit SecG